MALEPFLQRLFRYRATEKRTPLEDFLSEVLADFINRAPSAEVEQFILDCFVPAEMRNAFRLMLSNQRIDARTQVRLPDGRRLDLLLEVAGRPIIVIENKTWAAFQMHKRPASGERDGPTDANNGREKADAKEQPAAEYDHQLVTYGRWLAGTMMPVDWPGVLVVLTHAARAPLDFIASNVSHYSVVPHIIHWRNVHARLRRLVGPNDEQPSVPAWKFVGQELCVLLERYAMDSSDLSSVDISAINVAMSPLRKLEAVFAEIGAEILQHNPHQLIARGQSLEIQHEHSRFWGWTYFQGAGKLYVAYGVYFAPVTGELATTKPALSDQEHAFVAVGCDERTLDPGPNGFPANWVQVGDGWYVLKAIPLGARRIEERFPQFLARLVQEEFETILAIRDAHASATNQPPVTVPGISA